MTNSFLKCATLMLIIFRVFSCRLIWVLYGYPSTVLLALHAVSISAFAVGYFHFLERIMFLKTSKIVCSREHSGTMRPRETGLVFQRTAQISQSKGKRSMNLNARKVNASV